jgi:hypothetical protein
MTELIEVPIIDNVTGERKNIKCTREEFLKLVEQYEVCTTILDPYRKLTDFYQKDDKEKYVSMWVAMIRYYNGIEDIVKQYRDMDEERAQILLKLSKIENEEERFKLKQQEMKKLARVIYGTQMIIAIEPTESKVIKAAGDFLKRCEDSNLPPPPICYQKLTDCKVLTPYTRKNEYEIYDEEAYRIKSEYEQKEAERLQKMKEEAQNLQKIYENDVERRLSETSLEYFVKLQIAKDAQSHRITEIKKTLNQVVENNVKTERKLKEILQDNPQYQQQWENNKKELTEKFSGF